MKRFAVIGLGRFGKKLANDLALSGAEVIAIDIKRDEIDNIKDQVSLAVRLDSTDEDALRAQGIEKVDAAIVSIGQGRGGFEAAILTVVNLKNLGVKEIFARSESLIGGQVLEAIGANQVIYPEIESAQRWAYKLIAPQVGEKIDFAPGYSLARVVAPESFDGKTVMEIQLRQKYNVNLVAIKRVEDGKESERIFNVPHPDTKILKGDILMVVGAGGDIASIPEN